MKKTIQIILLTMLMWEVTIAQEVTHFMGYQIFMSKPATYEEGNIGGALIRLDSVTQCHAFYFHGAMMAIPIYLRQIQHIQEVTCVTPFQTDCELSSQTGTMYYGKAMDGTYFVEKQFSKEQQGLPSGILLFMIPPDYYEEVLLRLISLPNLPLELLNQDCGDGFEAHHTLPQKHRSEFEALDINIDEPGNVVWRKKENHRKQNHQHTKKWDDYINNHPEANKEDILKQRDIIEEDIWNNFSDSEWIIWFADSLDMNAEIGEMRNEYIFCRLQSEDAESFIEFLYYVINEKNKGKITKELQMPIHNDIDINRCKYNVSKSKIDRRFKKWLMYQLNHIEKF